jgi:hypothetical protein
MPRCSLRARLRPGRAHAPEEIIGKENIEVFFPKGFIEAGKLPQLISELISKERVSYEGEKVRGQ